MPHTIQPLISSKEIAQSVQSLGAQINERFQDRPLTILGVLTGSIVFVADLMRQIRFPHELGLLQASSYRGTATHPGELTINTDFLPDIKNRDVLLVDDILDTGNTLTQLVKEIRLLGPRSVTTAVLLWKKSRSRTDLIPEYVGFEIPDEFVVGYGLDYNGHYRGLPYIGVVDIEGDGQPR